MGNVAVVVRRTTYTSAGKMVVADVTFSGTYGAGGDTYTLAQFGFATSIDIIDSPGAVASATTGFVVAPDYANRKLRLLGGAASGIALAESAVANQTGTTVRVICHGDNPYI